MSFVAESPASSEQDGAEKGSSRCRRPESLSENGGANRPDEPAGCETRPRRLGGDASPYRQGLFQTGSEIRTDDGGSDRYPAWRSFVHGVSFVYWIVLDGVAGGNAGMNSNGSAIDRIEFVAEIVRSVKKCMSIWGVIITSKGVRRGWPNGRTAACAVSGAAGSLALGGIAVSGTVGCDVLWESSKLVSTGSASGEVGVSTVASLGTSLGSSPIDNAGNTARCSKPFLGVNRNGAGPTTAK